MSEPRSHATQNSVGGRIGSALLFLVAYVAAVYALMWLFIGVLDLGDPKFRGAPVVYFFAYGLYFAPAALFASLAIATSPTQLQRTRFGVAALAAITACTAASFLFNHELALVFSYAALLVAYFLYWLGKRYPKVG